MEEKTLMFGYRAGLPEGTKAAWGCRAIVTQDGRCDVPWDRSDAIGPDAERQELLSYLRETVGEQPWARARDLLKGYTAAGEYIERRMKTREEGEFVLYEDDRAIVKGNTQASAGYLYCVGYLKEHVPHGVAG